MGHSGIREGASQRRGHGGGEGGTEGCCVGFRIYEKEEYFCKADCWVKRVGDRGRGYGGGWSEGRAGPAEVRVENMPAGEVWGQGAL